MSSDSGSLSTSSSTSSTLELVGDELGTLTRSMAEISLSMQWSNCIEGADHFWRTIFLPGVLFYFTQALANTTLKSKAISSHRSMAEHAEMISKFDDKTLQEWKSATRNGVLKGDWSDLIKLGMNIMDYRMTSFLLNQHLSKASKSKHAECSLWCSGATQCVFLIFFSYDTHTYSWHRRWCVYKSVKATADRIFSRNFCLEAQLPRRCSQSPSPSCGRTSWVARRTQLC